MSINLKHKMAFQTFTLGEEQSHRSTEGNHTQLSKNLPRREEIKT